MFLLLHLEFRSVPPTVYANEEGIEVKEISTLRRAMPQFIAVGVKNLVLFGEQAVYAVANPFNLMINPLSSCSSFYFCY